MILADSSVWIDHLASENDVLASLLASRQLLIHPMVIGELACGNLRDRSAQLNELKDMEAAPSISDSAVLDFIETHQLMGKGIGFIDAHLLASVHRLGDPDKLWTLDRRLLSAAADLNIAFSV